MSVMENLLLPLGKGFAVIILNGKGVHVFGWLKPGAEVPWLILTESELQVV